MDCRIRDCRIGCREGSKFLCPLIFLVQPFKTTGTLTQSRKCYMKIQWHGCISRRMGPSPFLTLIYFNWKHGCPKNKFQVSPLVVERKSNLPACPLPDSTNDEDADGDPDAELRFSS